MKAWSLTIRSRIAAFLVVIGAIAAALAIAFAGLVLLAVLVALGALLALSAAIYYRLRGHKRRPAEEARHRAVGLDPAQEIFQRKSPKLPDVDRRGEQ